MSNQQDKNQQQQQGQGDNLSYGIQGLNLGAAAFNPNAQSYVPNQQYNQYAQYGQYGQQQQQQQQQQYGGYQQNQGYSQNQGYNQYSQYDQGYNQGYNQYNQGYQGYQQGYTGETPKQMTLDEVRQQRQEGLKSAPVKKKKLKLKLAGSSSIKIPQKKTEEKKSDNEVKAETKEVKAEPNAETKSETKTEIKVQPKPKVTKPEPKETKQDKKIAEKVIKASGPKSADAIIKQQEDTIDPATVRDMFGGKEHVSIIFMGHVDAGKSTMGGNLLYITGAVDKRVVERYEKEAKDAGRQGWYLSWIMDTDREERNDGKTIETGKAYFETDKRRYTILDAPGHKLYVSEMIGGASQADVGILVISARKGEYEAGFERGGQSREHAILAKTQGVNRLIVVINKMDDPTVNWSQQRYKECTKKLAVFLKNIGYSGDDLVFMPVSGYTGAGLKEAVPAKQCPWYTGPTLLDYLDNMPLTARKINEPFMLPIASKLKDMGTVVEGKIESGHVKKGTELILMPNKSPVEILTIYNETEAEADAAFCGEQVRLKLKGVNEDDINAGYVLTSKEHPVHTVTRFVAQVAIVELKSILSSGFSCVMHIHTAVEEVTFTKLLHKLEKGTNRKSRKPPAFAKKGMKIIAVLETEEPVCIETYNDYPELGRFTLRDQGETIAIGKVMKLL